MQAYYYYTLKTQINRVCWTGIWQSESLGGSESLEDSVKESAKDVQCRIDGSGLDK